MAPEITAGDSHVVKDVTHTYLGCIGIASVCCTDPTRRVKRPISCWRGRRASLHVRVRREGRFGAMGAAAERVLTSCKATLTGIPTLQGM